MSARRFWDRMLTVLARPILAILFISLAIGCSSPEKKEYARLARALNPILTAMKPAAARMLAANPDDHSEIIAACWSVDEQLVLLRDIEAGDHNHISVQLSINARIALLAKPYKCKPTPDRVAPCSRSCLANWNDLIVDVERLRVAASAEGVEIVSLDPR